MIRNRTGSLLLVLLALALVFTVSGCGDDADKKADSDDVNSAGLDAAGCTPAERPPAKEANVGKPTKKLDPDKIYVVRMETNCGSFDIELDVKNNPKTAASFAHLVEEGVYDNTWFHRIISDFVIQGGDPAGDGTGGVDYSVREKPRGTYKINSVAMAKTGEEPAGTSGSQFYVVIGVQGAQLPPEYALAGKVTDGHGSTERIAQYAAAEGDESGSPTGIAVVSKATLSVQ